LVIVFNFLATEVHGVRSRVHHTTPDLGLSSETQSDDGIVVDDIPQQVLLLRIPMKSFS
jgi:hypothetical protein